MHRCLIIALALAIALPAAATPPVGQAEAHPLDGSFVSIRVVGGFSPYKSVWYEVLWRARVAVAGHYRGLVGYDEAMHAMKLVPAAEFVSLLDKAGELGLFTLKDAPEPTAAPGALSYEIEARRGDKTVLVKVTGPDGQANKQYGQIIELVRTFVLARAGDLPFRNVFFEPGTFGYVNLTSVPVCKVHIDGRELPLETPIYGYELPAGTHEVKLVAVKEGWERSHTLRVEPGMTTIVHFDLR